MAAGKLGTENEGSFWYGDFNPQAGASVSLEMVVGFIRFGWSEMTSKHVLCNRVRPFSMLERRKPNREAGLQQLVCTRRVCVLNVGRNQETGVRIGDQ